MHEGGVGLLWGQVSRKLSREEGVQKRGSSTEETRGAETQRVMRWRGR